VARRATAIFVNGGAKTNQLAAQKFATCNAMI
jgi:hypothetical protein